MLATFKYLPGDTVIHRLDPRTKLLAFLLIMVCTIVVDDVRLLLLLLAMSLGYYSLARLPWRLTYRAWLVVFLFAFVIIGLINTTLFGRPPAFVETAHPIFSFPTIRLPWGATFQRTVTWEIALFGVVRMLRPLAIMAMVLPFTFTTDPHLYGVTFRRLGLPDGVAYALDLSLRYVPTVARDFFMTVDAQRARGYELESKAVGALNMIRRAAPLLVPVTISSIAAGEEIVDAMELRAFGVGPRTWLGAEALGLRRVDWIVLGWAAGTLLAFILLRLLTPFGAFWFPMAWFE